MFHYILFVSFKAGDQKNIKLKSTGNHTPSANPFSDEQSEEAETTKRDEEQDSSPFIGIIGECFLPYLYIYIESLDRYSIFCFLINII